MLCTCILDDLNVSKTSCNCRKHSYHCKMEDNIAPFGNFFRALPLTTRLELTDEEWVYTEEPHVERRRVCKSFVFLYFNENIGN